MSTMHVKIDVSTRYARAWVLLMSTLARFVGEDRAARWAVAGAWRLARFRLVGSRRWHRFPRDAHEHALDESGRM